MLVSHSHKFIFIKTQKTAGSSIQDYLARFCNEGIIEKHFPGSHRSAASTKVKIGNEMWETYTKICPIRNPWDKMVSWYFWRSRNRSTFVKVKRVLQGRHPENEARRRSFTEYIKWSDTHNSLNRDTKIAKIDGVWPDYFFIRYESLHEDMHALGKKLGFEYDSNQLPNRKTGFRDKRDYRRYYTEETSQLVRRAYEEDIKKFGYEF